MSEQTWKVLPRIRGYEIINQDGKVVGCYATPEIGQAHHVFALQEVNRLRTALSEIAEGRGRFSRDPFEHASNTIEDMKAIAVAALQGRDS